MSELVQPSVISVQASYAQSEMSPQRRRRARRARSSDGRWKSKLSCRQKASKFKDLPGTECAPTGHLSDRWWPRHGMWAIDTANGNSWATLQEAVTSKSCADAILAQQTKIFHEDRLDTAKVQARKQGWSAAMTLAHCTAATKGSGGAAVVVRKGSGIHGMTKPIIQAGMRHRICIAWVDAVV